MMKYLLTKMILYLLELQKSDEILTEKKKIEKKQKMD